MHVYTCMYLYVYAYIHIYMISHIIYIHTSTRLHRFAYTHTQIHTHTKMRTHTHTQVLVKGATEIRNTRTGSAVATPAASTGPEGSDPVGAQPKPKPVPAGKTVEKVTLASGKTVYVPTNSQRTGSRAPAPSPSECAWCFVRRGERRPLRAATAAAASACH